MQVHTGDEMFLSFKLRYSPKSNDQASEPNVIQPTHTALVFRMIDGALREKLKPMYFVPTSKSDGVQFKVVCVHSIAPLGSFLSSQNTNSDAHRFYTGLYEIQLIVSHEYSIDAWKITLSHLNFTTGPCRLPHDPWDPLPPVYHTFTQTYPRCPSTYTYAYTVVVFLDFFAFCYAVSLISFFVRPK